MEVLQIYVVTTVGYRNCMHIVTTVSGPRDTGYGPGTYQLYVYTHDYSPEHQLTIITLY